MKEADSDEDRRELINSKGALLSNILKDLNGCDAFICFGVTFRQTLTGEKQPDLTAYVYLCILLLQIFSYAGEGNVASQPFSAEGSSPLSLAGK